jgi:small subunit ribosomal protein YMR-31
VPAKDCPRPYIRTYADRSAPHAPAPHPAAPQAIKDDFQSFLSKLQSTSHGLNASSNPKGQSLESSSRGEVKPGGSGSSSSSGSSKSSSGGNGAGADSVKGPIASKPADYENFWEAPGYLWKIPQVSERESEAILVST